MPTEMGITRECALNYIGLRRMSTKVAIARRLDNMIKPHSDRVGMLWAVAAALTVMLAVSCGAAL